MSWQRCYLVLPRINSHVETKVLASLRCLHVGQHICFHSGSFYKPGTGSSGSSLPNLASLLMIQSLWANLATEIIEKKPLLTKRGLSCCLDPKIPSLHSCPCTLESKWWKNYPGLLWGGGLVRLLPRLKVFPRQFLRGILLPVAIKGA